MQFYRWNFQWIRFDDKTFCGHCWRAFWKKFHRRWWMCVCTCDSGRHSCNRFWFSSSLFNWWLHYHWRELILESLRTLRAFVVWVIVNEKHWLVPFHNTHIDLVWWPKWKNTAQTINVDARNMMHIMFFMYLAWFSDHGNFRFECCCYFFHGSFFGYKIMQINVHVHRKTMRCWMDGYYRSISMCDCQTIAQNKRNELLSHFVKKKQFKEWTDV